jgi:transcriptional regulator with XRE-family HTH domain
MASIGSRIAQIRKEHKFSQASLAEHVGVSKEAIGKYERNESLPSVETAKKMAEVLDVSLDYLVSENARLSIDSSLLKRLNAIEELTTQDKGHLLAIVDAFIRDAKTRLAYSA